LHLLISEDEHYGEEGKGNVNQVLVLSFGDTLLFWCVRTTCLRRIPREFKKRLKLEDICVTNPHNQNETRQYGKVTIQIRVKREKKNN